MRNANSPAGLGDPQIKELLWLFAGGSSEQFLIFQWQAWSRDYGRDPSAPEAGDSSVLPLEQDLWKHLCGCCALNQTFSDWAPQGCFPGTQLLPAVIPWPCSVLPEGTCEHINLEK